MKQSQSFDKALQAIRAGLIAGRWKPGDRLNTVALAEELGLSVSPIRDAVNELIAQDVLERHPQRGTCVAVHSIQDLSDLWDLRALLEGQAARWLAERAGEATLAALTTQTQQLDDFAVAASEQLCYMPDGPQFDDLRNRIFEAEDQFHSYFVECVGSRSLLATWRPRHFVTWTAMCNALSSGLYRVDGEFHLHAWVMEAVCSRDPQRAAETVQEHVLSAKDGLLRYMSLLAGQRPVGVRSRVVQEAASEQAKASIGGR